MKLRHMVLITLVTIAVVLGVMLVVVWNNKQGPESETTRTYDLSTDEHADHDGAKDLTAPGDNAEFNAAQAMREMYSYKPGEDKDRRDAGARAARYFIPKMAEGLKNQPETRPQPSAIEEWNGWAKSRDEVVAAARAIDSYVIGDVSTVTVEVVQTVLSPSIKTMTRLDPFTVRVTLTSTPDGWRVSTWKITEGIPH
ncbi:hypothetical protein [Corynebacterium sp. CCM 9203]|uniref:hypothetical protein n=1 Tax=Corynebacterium sp. CCM 9203 TaxID=3057615 RepID=UPI003525A317